MKALLFFFCTLFVLFSCQNRPADTSSSTDLEGDVEEIVGDTTPKATVILWVDKKMMKYENGTQIRTAKAKVTIHPEGKLSLHSFVKEQPLNVRRYLKYRLSIFQVTKIMMDSGHVKPGDQYVQLRYFLELAEKLK